ncbi:UDP-N-acetylmuramate dehydrogenase [Tistlia consotensis]|uniref:UDP-N-acetylenolpyruvoylglucosamine reductase n=1 Tax=Tistlia consotensis USBA 355 TaxID=560819 RepID=A0A1Y6CR28_9PROT|nr:UDP-N-acetylmuramate dehydrogenase [Tistlia consotensis]SMF71019.1 UDP-N-acetylmuramate dehydrogenase [Tistlia consotensis USBA 355]SNS06945.1 UDP-N-acetylmuramate dehydrogenase [Tistlia consotensis]
MSAAAATAAPRLIERLPAVRGRLTELAPLAGVTWFRVGGPAEVAFRPADRDDLIAFLKAKPADVPITVVGVASNLLIRDGGVRGVVLRLGRDFAGIEIAGGETGASEVTCGAGALDINVAQAAARAGIGGLEFLVGVPGTIGGALRMNAGAYGREIKDVLVWAEALGPDGTPHRLTPAEMGLSYRHCEVPADWIFVAARLRGHPDDAAAIARRMSEIQQARAESQPIRSRTGGSTFKNPPGERAWQLVDRAGCRGLRKGGAQVSEKHCNFLINTGTATAADLEGLGEEVRRRVKEATGIELQWEIKRIGEVEAIGQGGRS